MKSKSVFLIMVFLLTKTYSLKTSKFDKSLDYFINELDKTTSEIQSALSELTNNHQQPSEPSQNTQKNGLLDSSSININNLNIENLILLNSNKGSQISLNDNSEISLQNSSIKSTNINSDNAQGHQTSIKKLKSKKHNDEEEVSIDLEKIDYLISNKENVLLEDKSDDIFKITIVTVPKENTKYSRLAYGVVYGDSQHGKKRNYYYKEKNLHYHRKEIKGKEENKTELYLKELQEIKFNRSVLLNELEDNKIDRTPMEKALVIEKLNNLKEKRDRLFKKYFGEKEINVNPYDVSEAMFDELLEIFLKERESLYNDTIE